MNLHCTLITSTLWQDDLHSWYCMQLLPQDSVIKEHEPQQAMVTEDMKSV